MLEQVDSDQVLRLDKLPSHINPDVLYKDVSMAWNRRNNFVKHKILTPEELPQPGTLIAIDAEFVALQQEEMEFRSDGTKSILRPSHMSLARVSVLREDEVPFVDDYILTNETVADYLTEFSGIKSECMRSHSVRRLTFRRGSRSQLFSPYPRATESSLQEAETT